MTRVEQAVAHIADALGGKRVLEVACGCAEFSVCAAEIARTVCCIDLDDSRLLPQVGRRPNVTFRQMDAAEMQYGDGSFDTVVPYNAIGHLADCIEPVLEECLRVLGPGGAVYIISSFKMDKQVMEDRLLPLARARGLM